MDLMALQSNLAFWVQFRIYYTWHTGTFSGSKSPVAVWMLAFGGAAIVLGLATYGYNVRWSFTVGEPDVDD